MGKKKGQLLKKSPDTQKAEANGSELETSVFYKVNSKQGYTLKPCLRGKKTRKSFLVEGISYVSSGTTWSEKGDRTPKP